MTISELIECLQIARDKVGDVEINYDNDGAIVPIDNLVAIYVNRSKISTEKPKRKPYETRLLIE
jgi:hypothetical protein